MFSNVKFKLKTVFCNLTDDEDLKELRLKLPDVTIGLKNDVAVTLDYAS